MFSIIISDLFSALGKAIVAGAIIFGWLWASYALADAVDTFFSCFCWY